eukprot:gene9484-1690_t
MGQTASSPCKNIKVLLLGHTNNGKTTFSRLVETTYTNKPTEDDLNELWAGCSSYVLQRGIAVIKIISNEILTMENPPNDLDQKSLLKFSKMSNESENVAQMYDELLSVVEHKTFQNLLENSEDSVAKLLLRHFKNYDTGQSFSGFVNLTETEYLTYSLPSSKSTSCQFSTPNVEWTVDDTFGSFYDQKEIFSGHNMIIYFCSLVNYEKSKKEFQKLLDYQKFENLPILFIFTKADLFKLQNKFTDLLEYEESLVNFQKEIEGLCKDRNIIFWVPDDFRNPTEFKSLIELKVMELLTFSSVNEKLNFLKKQDPKELEFPFNLKPNELLDILSSVYTLASSITKKKKRSTSFFNQQKQHSDPSLNSPKSAFKFTTKASDGTINSFVDNSMPTSIPGSDLFRFFSTADFEMITDEKQITQVLEMLIEIGFLVGFEKKDYKFNESTSYLISVDGLKSYLSFESAIFIETIMKFHELKMLKYSSVDTIVQFHDLFSKGLEIKNRTHKFKKYSDCFIASEATKWMVENFNLSKPICEAFGQMLCNFDIFITNHPFYDSLNFVKMISENEMKQKVEKLQKEHKFLNF